MMSQSTTFSKTASLLSTSMDIHDQVDIMDVSAINTLTQITTLTDPDTKDEWPIKCYILTKDFTVGGHKKYSTNNDSTADRVWVNIERAASARS